MTRRGVLHTLAGAAASVYAPQGSSGAPSPKSKIKRGVSFYSYQEEYYTRAMTLEDCIAEAADIGALGIEFLAEQMAPDFPNPPDRWVGQWKDWMAKYGVTPACYTQFQDTRLHKDRPLTEKEAIDMMVRDLRLANTMGFKTMRPLNATPLDTIEKSLPYAEKYDIKVAIEIHSPTPLDGEFVNRCMDLISRTKTKHFGFTPDMGIFAARPLRVQRERQIREGMRESIATYIEKAWQDRLPEERVAAEVARMGGSPRERQYATSIYRLNPQKPRDLLKIMPYTFHIHAKFWEMTEDYREYSIPYEDIIPVLIEGGYDKHLASEYEGQRHTQDAFETDSCEQVRRQHVMFRRLLGEL